MDNQKEIHSKLMSDPDKIRELLEQRSQLYTSYSVRDRQGKFRSVIDIESVVELLQELTENKQL